MVDDLQALLIPLVREQLHIEGDVRSCVAVIDHQPQEQRVALFNLAGIQDKFSSCHNKTAATLDTSIVFLIVFKLSISV